MAPSPKEVVTMRTWLHVRSAAALLCAIGGAATQWGSHWEDLMDADALESESESFAARFRDPAWTWQR